MKTIALVMLLAAAGCSKKGSDCNASIAKGIEKITATIKTRASNPQMQELMTTTMAKLQATITQRCVEDKWASEVVQCFTTVTTMKDMQDCQGKLSDEQRSKLMTEIRKVRDESRASRMPDGVAGHPPTLTGSAGAGNTAGDGSATAPSGSAAPTGSAPPAGAPAGGSPPPPGSEPPAGSGAK